MHQAVDHELAEHGCLNLPTSLGTNTRRRCSFVRRGVVWVALGTRPRPWGRTRVLWTGARRRRHHPPPEPCYASISFTNSRSSSGSF